MRNNKMSRIIYYHSPYTIELPRAASEAQAPFFNDKYNVANNTAAIAFLLCLLLPQISLKPFPKSWKR